MRWDFSKLDVVLGLECVYAFLFQAPSSTPRHKPLPLEREGIFRSVFVKHIIPDSSMRRQEPPGWHSSGVRSQLE